MIPFKNVNTLEDVKKEYPRYFDLEFLKYDKVKKFIEEELNMLVEDSLDEAAFKGVRPKSVSKLRNIHLPTAQAKALYHYLWAIDHITDQMVKWGWNSKDITTLIKRMEKAGYDPYSTTEDTAGQFIESLKGHGFKKITTKYGDEFLVYNPKGYGDQAGETEEEKQGTIMESWKPIKDYPNYKVSNLGRVASIKTGVMKLYERRDGYLSVRLYKNGIAKEGKIHRLVAEAFIPNPNGKPQVNHISGDKQDNKVSNLEWVSAKENNEHAIITGLAKPLNEYTD